MIPEEELLKVIDIYQDALSGDLSDENLNKLILIDDKLNTSFLYKKPKILKEKSNE